MYGFLRPVLPKREMNVDRGSEKVCEQNFALFHVPMVRVLRSAVLKKIKA